MSIKFHFILINSFFLFSSIGFSQEKKLPAELKPFVAKGYEMYDFVEGDINGDNKKDAILILKSPGEDTAVDDDLKRPFLLLIRQQNGKLKLEKRTDSLVMCAHCGGVFGDPYQETKIFKNGFLISFYGGSNWRWGYDYTFTWNAAKQNWFLTKEHQLNYNSVAEEISTKESDIEADELGDIPIEKFNVDPAYKESKWEVIVTKAYFYTNPKTGSKPRKGYLLKGDKVSCTRILKNFVEVSFENKKEQFTEGYILKTDLQKIK